MKWNGMWTRLWEIQKLTFRWYKDYWFAYVIITALATVIYYSYLMVKTGYQITWKRKNQKVVYKTKEDYLRENGYEEV